MEVVSGDEWEDDCNVFRPEKNRAELSYGRWMASGTNHDEWDFEMVKDGELMGQHSISDCSAMPHGPLDQLGYRRAE